MARRRQVTRPRQPGRHLPVRRSVSDPFSRQSRRFVAAFHDTTSADELAAVLRPVATLFSATVNIIKYTTRSLQILRPFVFAARRRCAYPQNPILRLEPWAPICHGPPRYTAAALSPDGSQESAPPTVRFADGTTPAIPQRFDIGSDRLPSSQMDRHKEKARSSSSFAA